MNRRKHTVTTILNKYIMSGEIRPVQVVDRDYNEIGILSIKGYRHHLSELYNEIKYKYIFAHGYNEYGDILIVLDDEE